MKKTMKRLSALLIGMMIALSSAMAVYADEGYTYNYDYWGDIQYSPDAYEVSGVYSAVDFGLETGLKTPSGLFVYEDMIYICDTGNNRILEIQRTGSQTLELIRVIDSFKGAPNTLSCQFFDNYYHGKIDYWEARKLRTEHIYKIREKEGLPIKKGLFELLDYIRENGIKCAVATSTRRESAEKTLHTIGAWEYLDNVVYGDSVEHGKPEPDIFLSAADRIGVPPQECIVIEDSINGIKAGHAAGMKVVHVPDTIQIDDTIRALTYCVCEHLGEVPDVIEKLNAQV